MHLNDSPANLVVHAQRWTVLTIFALAIVICLSLPTRGVHAQSNNHNAAGYYQQAIDRLGEMSFSDAQWDAFYTYQSGPGGQPSNQVASMIRQLQPVLELTRKASTRDYSDFGLNYSEGIGLMLPHLGKLRTIAKVMDADTKLRMHNGDTAGAARNLASVYRMGSHAADDRILISSLVANAIFASGDAGMQYGFDHGLFNEADAATMLKAANEMRADDPFKMVEAIMMEGDVFIGWIKDELTKEDGAQTLAQAFSMTDADAEQYEAMFSAEGIDEQFASIDIVMDEMVEIFSMDDHDTARERLSALEEKLVAGEYGELSMVLLPAYGKVFDNMIKSELMLAQRKTMLEEFVRGDLKAAEVLNAAVLYMQAMDDWLKLEASTREQIRTFARDGGVVTEELSEALKAAAPIIATLTQASQLKRCDFQIVRGRGHPIALCERYVIGMRELWDVLLSDAIAATRRGEMDIVTSHLATSLRMSGQLAADHTLAGAVTCQYAYNRTAELLIELLDDDRLTAEHLALLRPVVLAVDRRDPFGAIDTMVHLRGQAAAMYAVNAHVADETALKAAQQAAQDVYDQWSGDHFLYIRAAAEYAAAQQTAPSGAQELIEAVADELTIERMDGILSMKALAEIQRDGGYVLSLFEQGELDVFAGVEIPLLSDFQHKQMRARSDVRALHRVLRLTGSSEDEGEGQGEGESK